MADLPVIINDVQIVSMLSTVLDSYNQSKATIEMQKTEREKIIQEAKIWIAKYENDAKVSIAKIQKENSENLKIIELIETLIVEKELNEHSVEMCERILDKLI